MTVQLRDKSDRFVYTKLGEKISDKTVMAYLGKTIPVCFVSDASLDVMTFPADKNTGNILPSNFLYLQKRFIGEKFDQETMANIQTCYGYVSHTLASGEKVDVTLTVPTFAMKRATAKVLDLLSKFDDFGSEEFDPDLVLAVWDKLMYDGAKGLFEVKISKDGVTFGIDVAQACEKFISRTLQRNKSVAGLQI
jgi:hypothetical protein